MCKTLVFHAVVPCVFQRSLQKEKQRMEHANTANTKFLHECGILHDRLQECSVDFLVEEEDKLTVDPSSPYDAIDLLTTSDDRIGLLLAEVYLTSFSNFSLLFVVIHPYNLSQF